MATENYRVFLSVAGADVENAIQAARRLLDLSYRKDRLFVIGPPSVVERFASAEPAIRCAFEIVSLPSGCSHSDAISTVLDHFHDLDFAFVQSGVGVPRNWDIRLAWTASRTAGVATVSPITLSDLAGESFSEKLGTDTGLLDELCFGHTQFAHLPLAGFLEECVFVSGKAVRELIALERSGKIADRLGWFKGETRRLHYTHALADHILVRTPRAPSRPEHSYETRHSGPRALAELRHKVLASLREGPGLSSPLARSARPRQLHLMHSWGGGLDRWVREYCRADDKHDNFVLKSIGNPGAHGLSLALFRHIDEVEPIRTWSLSPPIQSTVSTHSGYRAILAEIAEHYGIETVIVSSLVGHSLDALRLGRPTALVCHDYYPYCPALNITFENLCHKCTADDLVACTAGNPHNRFFPDTPPSAWLETRTAFVEAIRTNRVALIAPSASVRDNYCRLIPELEDSFHTIPHGSPPIPAAPLQLEPGEDRRLRVLILGRLSPDKGLFLFEQIRQELSDFADVFLLGCGEDGKKFARTKGVKVIPRYRWEELAEIVGEIRPDAGLLPSVVPETFSFTLQELLELAIPPVVTDLGSFHDRIQDGVNGFLCRPRAEDILARLKSLAADRRQLTRVHHFLRTSKVRNLTEMLADYEPILGTPEVSAKAYFCADAREIRKSFARCELRSSGGGVLDIINSQSVRHGPERQVLRFSWNEQVQPLNELRIRPAGGPDVMVLFRIRLLDSEGSAVWTWEGDPALLKEAPRKNITMLLYPGDSIGTLLVIGVDDARLGIPAGAETLERVRRGGSLEMEFVWPSPVGAKAIILKALKHMAAAPPPVAEWNLLVGQLSSLLFGSPQIDLSLQDLQRELSQAHARILDLENSLSWRLSLPLRITGKLYLKAASRFRK
jgi:glycosyltransferase involved in cell wall biosynthesis